MSEIFVSITNGSYTAANYLICTACAILCGLIAAVVAGLRSSPSKSFLVSLILLPPIVQTVIMMVNGNVGTGVAVMGAFSLVRFRSVPGKAKDIVSIFMAMTAGLACAGGYVGVALLFTVVVCAAMAITAFIPVKAERTMDLRITVPESISFSDAFDEVLREYTREYKLTSVKTVNMGSLYKLKYQVVLRDSSKTRELIDKLRVRNGNLEISLSVAAMEGEEL